jgi:hypothetical protein
MVAQGRATTPLAGRSGNDPARKAARAIDCSHAARACAYVVENNANARVI